MFNRKHFLMDSIDGGDGSSGGGGSGGDSNADTSVATNSDTIVRNASPTETSVAEWHGLTEPDDLAYVANKGWQSAQDMYKSYRGVEKLIGRNPDTLIEMPRADDPEGFRSVMSKLGLPADAKDYKFDKPEDLPVDESYMDWARGEFHKIGLTGKQVEDLTKGHNEYLRNAMQMNKQDYENGVAADEQSLKREWGAGYDRMVNTSKNAASSLGFSEQMIDAIEMQIGYGATMKFFAGLGQKMAEDGFVSGDGGSRSFGGNSTPAEAKAQWDQLKLDESFVKALHDSSHPGHAAAKDKQTKLFNLMYPDG